MDRPNPTSDALAGMLFALEGAAQAFEASNIRFFTPLEVAEVLRDKAEAVKLQTLEIRPDLMP